MEINFIATIVISILSSSVVTLLLSSYVIEPMKERRKYTFDEKKHVYEAIIIFAQITLYPQEAKCSLGVEIYDIRTLSDEENIKNAISNLKMSIPKLRLISKNNSVIEKTKLFIEHKNEDYFNQLVTTLQKDLYK